MDNCVLVVVRWWYWNVTVGGGAVTGQGQPGSLSLGGCLLPPVTVGDSHWLLVSLPLLSLENSCFGK